MPINMNSHVHVYGSGDREIDEPCMCEHEARDTMETVD